MSDQSAQPAQPRVCPQCGNAVPAPARYCPSCGTRLPQQTPWDARAFEDAIADVLDDTPTEARSGWEASSQPGEQRAGPTATGWGTAAAADPEQREQAWSASQEAWTASPAGATGWGAAPEARQSRFSGSRALWIVLAILGFLVFCCCGLIFLSVAVSSEGGAGQVQVLHLLQ